MRIVVPIIALVILLMLTLHYGLVERQVEHEMIAAQAEDGGFRLRDAIASGNADTTNDARDDEDDDDGASPTKTAEPVAAVEAGD